MTNELAHPTKSGKFDNVFLPHSRLFLNPFLPILHTQVNQLFKKQALKSNMNYQCSYNMNSIMLRLRGNFQ